MISSLPFPEDGDLDGVESRIQTSFSRIVPGPHLDPEYKHHFQE